VQFDNTKIKKNAHGKEFGALEYKIIHPKYRNDEQIMIIPAEINDVEMIEAVKTQSRLEHYVNEELNITPDLIRERFERRKVKSLEYIQRLIVEGNPPLLAKAK